MPLFYVADKRPLCCPWTQLPNHLNYLLCFLQSWLDLLLSYVPPYILVRNKLSCLEEFSSGCDLTEEFWLFHRFMRIKCLFCHFKQLIRCPLKCLKYLLVLSQTCQHSWIHANCDFKSCLSEAHNFYVRSQSHCLALMSH